MRSLWRSLRIAALVLFIATLGGMSVGATAPLADVKVGLQVNMFSQVVKVLLSSKDFLSRHGGNFTITWVQTTSGPGLNDALATNSIQAGFQAGPPFLIAWSHGIPIKIASDAGILPSDLVTRDPKIRTVKDIPAGVKIALPAPGSLQDIALQMAAVRYKLDSDMLTGTEVAMSQADALAGLMGGQITALFGAPPFTTEALAQPGYRSILSVKDVYEGKYPFHLFVATTKFASDNPKEFSALVAAVRDALAYAKANPDEVAELLHKDNPKIEAALFKRDLANPRNDFSIVPGGLMKTARFMGSQKTIPKVPGSVDELVFPNLRGAN